MAVAVCWFVFRVGRVTNLLQVVSGVEKDAVVRDDSVIEHRVKAYLKADGGLDDVEVASVNKGVVLLSGKTRSLEDKLRAVFFEDEKSHATTS